MHPYTHRPGLLNQPGVSGDFEVLGLDRTADDRPLEDLGRRAGLDDRLEILVQTLRGQTLYGVWLRAHLLHDLQYALGVLEPELRPVLAERIGRTEVVAVERSAPGGEFAELWEEMTTVRRSAPVGAQW